MTEQGKDVWEQKVSWLLAFQTLPEELKQIADTLYRLRHTPEHASETIALNMRVPK